MAACLKIDVLFDDWERGLGPRWGDATPDLYLAGCDIGPYTEHVDSGIDEHIRAVPASLKGPLAKTAGLRAGDRPARRQGAPPTLTLIGPRRDLVDMRTTRSCFACLRLDDRPDRSGSGLARANAIRRPPGGYGFALPGAPDERRHRCDDGSTADSGATARRGVAE